MMVRGAQAAGKTRAVLEALSSVRDQVVWAREVPLLPTSLIQVLDDSRRATILVVDAGEGQTDPVIRRGLEAPQLKTIIIASEFIRAPGTSVLSIDPFDQATAMEFMRKALPRTPFSWTLWLYDQFGGLPGLLLQGATALKAVGDRDPLEHEDFEAILDAYERTVTAPLGAASETLTVLSVLPRVKLSRGVVSPDLRLICEAIGVNPRRIPVDLELLRARNLVEQVEFPTYEALQVTPPLLARRCARKAILGIIVERLPYLIERLSPEGRAALVRRIGESAQDPRVRKTLEWLFADAGIFTDVATLATHAGIAAALAETVPVRTARALLETLKAADAGTRRDILRDDPRREVVRALDGLIHRRETFDDAAEALLLLAEAENEHWASSATGVFTNVFHWKHPEIPKDARLRAILLERLARGGTPGQRQIIAKAAGAALETHGYIMAHQGQSIAPPELGWRPRTWGDVHGVIRPLVALLKRLDEDEIPEVKDTACRALAIGTVSTFEVGISDEGMDALEFLAGLPLNPELKAVVAESVASLVWAIRQNLPKMTEPHRAAQEQLATRGDALFTRMTAQDFRARFHHWLGPAPMRAESRMHGGSDGFEKVRAEAERLAQDVIANPDLLSADLLDWATGEEAGNAGAFLWHLGRLDRGGQWREQLEARVPQMRVGGALAVYVAGWADSDAAAASAYLEAIAGRGGNWSFAAAETTWRLGPTPQNAHRLLRCVTEGHIDPKYVARFLSYGKWPTGLPVDDLIDLINGLRDKTNEVDWALVEVVEACWPHHKDKWDQLGPIAVDLLINTAGRPPRRQENYHWDALAAQLVPWNVDGSFRMLFVHLELPPGEAAVFLRFDRAQLLHALSTADRPRLVRALIAAASRGPRSAEVRFDLPNLLHPTTDSQILIQLIDEEGIEAARLIASHLDADQEGYQAAFEMLGTRWGDDDEVRHGLLHSTVMIRSTYSDKGAVLLPRLSLVEQLRGHQNPRVAEMAVEGRQLLLKEMERN
jgi:hypothetical protein